MSHIWIDAEEIPLRVNVVVLTPYESISEPPELPVSNKKMCMDIMTTESKKGSAWKHWHTQNRK
jgi:hypothetical protein